MYSKSAFELEIHRPGAGNCTLQHPLPRSHVIDSILPQPAMAWLFWRVLLETATCSWWAHNASISVLLLPPPPSHCIRNGGPPPWQRDRDVCNFGQSPNIRCYNFSGAVIFPINHKLFGALPPWPPSLDPRGWTFLMGTFSETDHSSTWNMGPQANDRNITQFFWMRKKNSVMNSTRGKQKHRKRSFWGLQSFKCTEHPGQSPVTWCWAGPKVSNDYGLKYHQHQQNDACMKEEKNGNAFSVREECIKNDTIIVNYLLSQCQVMFELAMEGNGRC